MMDMPPLEPKQEDILVALDDLIVAPQNCRKDLTDEESSIRDLADDLKQHGLLNPLVVRKCENKYEIICGQRRYLAAKSLEWSHIKCSMHHNLSDHAAERLSLAENIQRANLTSCDKVRIYNRLYELCGQDINKLSAIVSLGVVTLNKYIKIASLPPEIISRLDAKGDDRLTMETARCLTDVPVEKMTYVADAVVRLGRNDDRSKAIRQMLQHPEQPLGRIVDEIQLERLQTMTVHPSFPWVPDFNGTPIPIPKRMWSDILQKIQISTDEDEVQIISKRMKTE